MYVGDCWHGAPLGSPGHTGVNVYTPGACTWTTGGWNCNFYCKWNGTDCGGFTLLITAVCPSDWPLSGAVCKSTNWAANGESYAYDARGNLTQVTDPRGKATNKTYNALNQLTQILQPAATTGGTRPTINMANDARNQVTSVTDPRGLVTSYDLDGLGNRTSLTSPDTGTTTNTFDVAGNVLTSTDARGKVTGYSYDAMNRPLTVSFPTGRGLAFEYDGGGSPQSNDLGRLTRITDETGSARYRYDALGRVIEKTQLDSSGTRTRVVSYTYGTSGTLKGKLASVTYPSGTLIAYTYDTAGRVASIALTLANNGSTTTTNLMTSIKYDAMGAPTGWTWGNGALYARTYDAHGRLTQFPLGVITAGTSSGVTVGGLKRTASYDAASRLTAMNHADTAGSTSSAGALAANTTNAYDDLNRLVTFTAASSAQGYAYDLTGNRTQWTVGGSSHTNTIGSTSNQVTGTTGPTPFKTNSYDAAGNLTSDGTIAFTYNDRGRMESSTHAGVLVSYGINGLGQRMFKSGPTSTVPTGKTYFMVDESGHLIGEYGANNSLLAETIWLGDLPVGVVQSQSGAVMVDNTDTADVVATGSWISSTAGTDYEGADVQTRAAGSGDSFAWKLAIPSTGTYNVYAKWIAGDDRASDASYTIATSSGDATVTANQQSNGGAWVLLGSYNMTSGTGSVTLAQHATGLVVADAVKAVPVGVDVNTEYYVHADQINTPRVIVRPSDNKMVWRWDGADPFGVAVADEDPSALGNFTYNLRFPGQVFDKETNLHYNYFRDYDPQVGRYVQSDPIGLRGGLRGGPKKRD